MKRAAAALCAALLSTLPAYGVRGADDLDLATVRANMKNALGIEPPFETIKRSLIRHGETVDETQIRSGDDYRIDTSSDGRTASYGRFHGIRWAQSRNGQTVEHTEPLPEPVVEFFNTKLAHERTPDDRYVISHLTALGYGTVDYVDPATWLVAKHEAVTPAATTVTTYSDYRATNGYTRPWHAISSEGRAEDTTEEVVRSIATDAVPERAFEIPKTKRRLVEFPDGVTSVVLPGRRTVADFKFIVRLTINGRGLDFLLDSGAGQMTIDRDVAQSLGLHETHEATSSSSAGRFVTTRVVVPEINIGTLQMHDVELTTIPHVAEDTLQYRTVGLLGFDFLDAICAKLDYENGTVTAYDPDAFVPPPADHAIPLEIRLGTHTPEVPLAVNGALGSRFTIDTGGAGALMIFDYFRRHNPNAAVDERNSPFHMQLSGVGGGIDATNVVLKNVALGGYDFNDFRAFVLSSPKQYANDGDGIIGPELLHLFDVYFDYGREKAYLVPR